jgi:hypothetical protein
MLIDEGYDAAFVHYPEASELKKIPYGVFLVPSVESLHARHVLSNLPQPMMKKTKKKYGNVPVSFIAVALHEASSSKKPSFLTLFRLVCRRSVVHRLCKSLFNVAISSTVLILQ